MPTFPSYRSCVAISVAVLMSIGAGAPPVERSGAAAHRLRGLEHGYNLDYPEALAAFQDALVTDPDDATAYRLAAATLWMRLLFHQGAVTVEDYLGRSRANVRRRVPPPEFVSSFHQYLERSLALAEQRLRRRPEDANAYCQLGAAAALRASYIATIEGSVRESLGPARRAYGALQRCMTLDPTRQDAGVLVGLYQYTVGSEPLPMRLLARVAGLDGNRDNGLRLVEQAAADSSDVHVQTQAALVLVLLYSREARAVDALRIVHELQKRYPRNRLLRLEAGGAALRAGRPAEALRALDEGLLQLSQDPRPRAYGEEARWRYLRGAALVALRQREAAGRELHAALAEESPAWVRGRTHLELGKLADLSGGDRREAVAAYRRAIGECRADHDAICSDEAGKLIHAAYR